MSGGGGGSGSGGGGGKPPSQVPDDPLLKPASEVGWDEPKRARAEVDPAAPRKPASRVVEVKPSAPVVTPAATTKPAATTSTPLATTATTSAPTEAKPEAVAEAKPADAKPADAKLADAKPADAKPPAEAKPEPAAEAKPEPATEAKPEALAVESIARPADANHELRAAIGATPLARKRHTTERDLDEELVDEHAPRSLRTTFIVVGSIAAVLAIGTFVVLGRVNSDRFALACEAERAVPQQGRAFPPWGYHALAGDPWRPLKIAPETRCQARETDDERVLERWFLAMILDEVTAELTAHEPARLDETDALLKQSLLLTRPPPVPEPESLATERSQQHKDIERMLGDVTFWRAAAKLRDAATALTDAAKQFDAAAAQRPRHATDAAAWGAYARKLSDQLRVGPTGGAPPSLNAPGIAAPSPASPPVSDVAAATDTPSRPPAPQGTALPVEPDKPHDAEPAKPEPEPTPPPAPAPAATPTGGVLL